MTFVKILYSYASLELQGQSARYLNSILVSVVVVLFCKFKLSNMLDQLIEQQLDWLEKQSIITSCVWEVKEGRITFKLHRGKWMCTANFIQTH